MASHRKRHACFALATALVFHGQISWAQVDAEDQELIDAASCEELAKEHRNYAAAEKEVADGIRQSGNSTTATNVLGVATLATLGFGFFEWDDTSDAETNLAELRGIREAIEAAAKKKSCDLAAP
jgi:hypothetical protein